MIPVSEVLIMNIQTKGSYGLIRSINKYNLFDAENMFSSGKLVRSLPTLGDIKMRKL